MKKATVKVTSKADKQAGLKQEAGKPAPGVQVADIPADEPEAGATTADTDTDTKGETAPVVENKTAAQKKAEKKAAKEAEAEKKAAEKAAAKEAKAAAKAQPKVSQANETDPTKMGKLALVRYLRAQGISREDIIKNHKDNEGNPFHPVTVSIQSAKVEKKLGWKSPAAIKREEEAAAKAAEEAKKAAEAPKESAANTEAVASSNTQATE